MKRAIATPLAAGLAAWLSACVGSAYLPAQAGGAESDISGLDVRQQWVDDHPETSPEIREAILEGAFVPGMTLEHRDVITNPRRQATTGNGYWRSHTTEDEVRYRWFVASERLPFADGLGRSVCELIYVEGALKEVRYCGAGS
jgi:hypothetical protein